MVLGLKMTVIPQPHLPQEYEVLLHMDEPVAAVAWL